MFSILFVAYLGPRIVQVECFCSPFLGKVEIFLSEEPHKRLALTLQYVARVFGGGGVHSFAFCLDHGIIYACNERGVFGGR